MKTLSGFLLTVTVLFFFPTAQAQSQDTALARIDTKELQKKTDKPSNETRKSSEDVSVENEAVAPQVKFVVPEVRDKTSKGILDTKAGPNGEDIQMDKQGYYYLDEAGKKVRIDSKALRDKPKHS
jgi:carboxypeptidase C (cathepsin A)